MACAVFMERDYRGGSVVAFPRSSRSAPDTLPPSQHSERGSGMRCRSTTKLLLVSALFLAASTAWPQEDQPAPIDDSTPRRHAAAGERIDVDVVNVDVYVSDKKGNPVTDLAQGDFQVFEDEKKVKVTNFLSGGEIGRQELSVVIYVDVTQLKEATRRAAVEKTSGALATLMADGSLPVMIVGFDGLMHMEQDFTTDFAKVAAALHRVQDRTPPPSQSVALERSTRDHRRRHHAALPCGRRLGDPGHQHHGQHLLQRPGLRRRGAPRDRSLGRRPDRVRQRAGRAAGPQSRVRGRRRHRDASARGADDVADALAVATWQRLGARRAR